MSHYNSTKHAIYNHSGVVELTTPQSVVELINKHLAFSISIYTNPFFYLSGTNLADTLV